MSQIIATVNKVELKDGTKIFYREAGSKTKPNFLLLHGYPTSSYMYRNLIPLLAPHFHVIAPDLPGFGFTEPSKGYEFKFANLTDSIDEFLSIIKLDKFLVYIFDYGAPVAFRLALKNPSRITGIVAQNGNAYEEGIDDRFWAPVKKYWATGNEEDEGYVSALSEFVRDKKNILSQYYDGVEDPGAVDPAPAALDEFLFQRPGQTKIQLGLFFDYQNNVKLYPQFQEFLRSSGVPVLVQWGKNDIIFSVEGAEAYKRDVKKFKAKYYETGHFALETHVNDIASEIIDFFA